MTVKHLEADYLVYGAGAMGIAFVDELINLTKNNTVVLVGKNPRPGGHWNYAYSFVQLHQPSLFYGVNSEKFNTKDSMYATQSEILYYFEKVVRKLEKTGRLIYIPQCEYVGDKEAVSLIAPDTRYKFTVRKKIVNATFMEGEIPSLRPPKYEVSDDATLVPINGISRLKKAYDRYVIIGAGKTGIDAILYLLGKQVKPDDIHWIVSSDSWLLDRESLVPKNLLGTQKKLIKAMAEGKNVDAVIQEMCDHKMIFQLDENIRPTKFRCATVSRRELAQLRSIKHVHRMGHVHRIGRKTITLAKGDLPTGSNVLHIDCTANALTHRTDPTKVFDGDTITLQSLFTCQQVYSAALIAKLETLKCGDERKNGMAIPAPHPDNPDEYVLSMEHSLMNTLKWLKTFPSWYVKSRLQMLHHANKGALIWTGLTFFRKVIPKAIQNIRRMRLDENYDKIHHNTQFASIYITPEREETAQTTSWKHSNTKRSKQTL